jgi:hypothetical protein
MLRSYPSYYDLASAQTVGQIVLNSIWETSDKNCQPILIFRDVDP